MKTLGFLGYTDAYGEQWLKEVSPLLDKAGIKLVATERFAVDCGDHGFRRLLDAVDQLRELRILRGLAEFLDVRAGEERTAGADDHQRVQVSAGIDPFNRLPQTCSYAVRERVHRRMVDFGDRDATMDADGDGAWHACLRR